MFRTIVVLSLLFVSAFGKITISNSGSGFVMKREASKDVEQHHTLMGLRAGEIVANNLVSEAKSTHFTPSGFLRVSAVASLALAAGLLFAPGEAKLHNILNIPLEPPRALVMWAAAGLVGWANGLFTASHTNTEAGAREYCQRNLLPLGLILGRSIMEGGAYPLHYAFFVPMVLADIYFSFLY